MNLCPITYSPCGENRYSEGGLKLLASGLKTLKNFEYTAEEQRIEAYNRASKMSIQGVQPKLSAVLNIKDEKFELVDKGGKYILKPQHNLYYQMPENEDLTMRLAELTVTMRGINYCGLADYSPAKRLLMLTFPTTSPSPTSPAPTPAT